MWWWKAEYFHRLFVMNYERYIGGGKLTSIDSSYWQIGKDDVPPGYATAYGSMKGFRELYESILDEIDNA
jgi:hypothetical protein